MQPQRTTCTSCGADLMPEARFCRRCGQPTSHLNRASVTEATTLHLGNSAAAAAATPPAYGQELSAQQAEGLPTQPAHGQTQHSLSAVTHELAPAKNHGVKWMLFVLVMTVLLLIPLVVYLTSGPTIIKKGVSPETQAPPAPPAPPVPPAKGASSSTTIDPSFIYPGARTTMEMTRVGQGSTVQLETSDSVQKVVEWYTARLKPSAVMRQPGAPVVLATDDMKAIITPLGNGTTIILKQGAD